MTYYPLILLDTGPLVAFYNRRDRYHQQACEFFATCNSRLVTTVSCVTEVMWLLSADWRVQNEFLLAVAKGVFECESLLPQDYVRVAELNAQYADLPGDVADLSLVAISERLSIEAIATVDSNFDVYRRNRNQAFVRVGFT